MERKTSVHADEGRNDIIITREFDLPIELLFMAYTEAEFIEQWMNTKVLVLENRRYGSWRFRTSDSKGNVAFEACGVYHNFTPNASIVRTFEMEGTSFGVQLEFLTFERIADETSRLTMNSVYRSVEQRDQVLKLPFAYGINMAHNRLQEILNQRI